MTDKEIRALILKRLDQLNRLYDDREDPIDILNKEYEVIEEAAEAMARGGFPGHESAGRALLSHRKTGKARSFLWRCLKTLRLKSRAGSNGAGSDSDMLTPPQVAKRYGVSPDTVRAWIASGSLRAINVGGGKLRPRHRVPAEALKELDAKRPARITPKAPAQRRRRRTLDLPFTRYTSRPKASPERAR